LVFVYNLYLLPFPTRRASDLALAGLPDTTPAVTVNRFCSSGLQSIAYAAERIMVGHADAIIAGGVESMSMVPMMGNVIRPNTKRSEEHTSELQSRENLVCRLL